MCLSENIASELYDKLIVQKKEEKEQPFQSPKTAKSHFVVQNKKWAFNLDRVLFKCALYIL